MSALQLLTVIGLGRPRPHWNNETRVGPVRPWPEPTAGGLLQNTDQEHLAGRYLRAVEIAAEFTTVQSTVSRQKQELWVSAQASALMRLACKCCDGQSVSGRRPKGPSLLHDRKCQG